MENFIQVRRSILSFLSSLRSSIDRPGSTKMAIGDPDREIWMQAILLIEDARIRFNSSTRFRQSPRFNEWALIKNEVLSSINELKSHLIEKDARRNFRFRAIPILVRDESELDPNLPNLLTDAEHKLSVIEAIELFEAYLESVQIFDNKNSVLTFKDLAEIVPAQQLAPMQFRIRDGKVSILQVSSKPESEGVIGDSIKTAYDHIKDAGDRLIKELECSNCDKRLLEKVCELHDKIKSHENVISIGLTNLACSKMCSAFQNEMPDAIGAMFVSYNSSISLYTAQFPEWVQFTQVANSIEIDDDDIVELDGAVSAVIDKLKQNPDIADPEVPRTMEAIRNFLSFPRKYAKRAVFAVVRTIENLISVILRYGLTFVEKTADSLVETGSKVASKMIISLLVVALAGATGVGGIATEVGSGWVKQAGDVVQKQLDKMQE